MNLAASYLANRKEHQKAAGKERFLKAGGEGNKEEKNYFR